MDKNTNSDDGHQLDSLPIDTTVFNDRDSSAVCYMYDKAGRAHALCFAYGKQIADAEVNFATSGERDKFVDQYVEKIRRTEH